MPSRLAQGDGTVPWVSRSSVAADSVRYFVWCRAVSVTTMETSVGPLTTMYLERCGYTEGQIGRWDGETRLLQDIGLAGDNAWDEFSLMRQEFGVDLTGFEMDTYFPSELSWETLMVSLFWWTKVAHRIKDKYPPITLAMIERVLVTKRWELP